MLIFFFFHNWCKCQLDLAELLPGSTMTCYTCHSSATLQLVYTGGVSATFFSRPSHAHIWQNKYDSVLINTAVYTGSITSGVLLALNCDLKRLFRLQDYFPPFYVRNYSEQWLPCLKQRQLTAEEIITLLSYITWTSQEKQQRCYFIQQIQYISYLRRFSLTVI